MMTRLPHASGDTSTASAVRAGDLVFLSHHAGDFSDPTYVGQTRAALAAMEETLSRFGADRSALVSLTLWIREFSDGQRAVWDAMGEFFGDQPPARMTATTDFFEAECLVQVEGVASLG